MAVKKYLDLVGLQTYHGLLETNYLNGVADIIKNTAVSGDPVYEIKTGATLVASPSAGDNTTKIATTAYVQGEIAGIATPMIFKGTADGALPTGSPIKVGYTYKVITSDIANVPTGSGTSETAKVGDTIICTTADSRTGTATYWSVIPSGDEPSGTVTSVAVESAGAGAAAITVSGTPVTSSGTITLTVNAATNSALGVVQTGTNITNTDGVISVADATTTGKGVVQIGNNIDVNSGTISVAIAESTSGKLGVVKAGTNVAIDGTTGAVNVATGSGSTKGVLQVGTNLSVAEGVVSVNTGSATASEDPEAVTTTLGVLAPDYISIQATSGVISVNTIQTSEVEALFA